MMLAANHYLVLIQTHTPPGITNRMRHSNIKLYLIVVLCLSGSLLGCLPQASPEPTAANAGAEIIISSTPTRQPSPAPTTPPTQPTAVATMTPLPQATSAPTATFTPTASRVPSPEICQLVTEIPRTECEALAAIYLHNSDSWQLTFTREEPWLLSDKPATGLEWAAKMAMSSSYG
jgi:hypothetical protein